MSLTNALTLSIGLLAAIATWAFLGPLAGSTGWAIWIAFVGWAAYFHSGGTSGALASNIPAHVLGVLVGAVALYLIGNHGTAIAGNGPLTAGIIVGLGAAFIVQMSKIGMFGNIPCAVYGFACVAGYTLLTNGIGNLSAAGFNSNPIIVVSCSLIVGSFLGWLSGAFGGSLAKS